jgi:hypothetical protein
MSLHPVIDTIDKEKERKEGNVIATVNPAMAM